MFLKKKKKEKKNGFGCSSILLVLLVIGISLYFYKFYFNDEKQWITTINGVKIYNLDTSHGESYIWNGSILGGCAHDNGILTTISQGKRKERKVKMYWGSLNGTDWKNVDTGKFIGNVSGDKSDGFGILRVANKVYVGNFEKGKLNGYAKEYSDNNLVYRGGFKDGMYNGFGALFKDGEFTAGNWKQGNLSEGFLSDKSESVSRIWHRYFGKNKSKEKFAVLTSEEFAQLDTNEFQQYLASLLDNYIENKITETTENRTAFFSVHPIRMFWQTLFTPRNERTHDWIQAFTQNGLAKDDIEFFINSYINDFNKKNKNNIHLQSIKINNINDKSIIDDKTFETLHDMEFAGWSQNFWFDGVLTYAIMFIITGIISVFLLPLAGYLKIIDFIVSGIVIVLVIILSFVLEDIKPDFIQTTFSNYTSYLFNQDIFQKML